MVKATAKQPAKREENALAPPSLCGVPTLARSVRMLEVATGSSIAWNWMMDSRSI